MNDRADRIMAVLHDLTTTEQIVKVSQVDKITIANALAALFPPPEACTITLCERGNLAIREYLAGFAIEFNPSKPNGKAHWLSDGVDMMFTEDGESISPGTHEWWQAAYHWLGNETELMEAYFPELLEVT